jgi:hypothetical protein
MPLPKIEYPLTSLHLESLGCKVHFRPILVKEEKVLLMAKQSGNDSDIFTAIKHIVNNCVVSVDRGSFDVDRLPIHELEFLFLNLRIQSMGKRVDLSYKDQEDGEEYKFQVNLEDIKIKHPDPKPDPRIEVSDGIGVVMRYPPASLYDNRKFLDAKSITEISAELTLASIEKVYDDDDVYPMDDVPREEAEQFLDGIPSEPFRKMQEFLAAAPRMEHVISFKNKSGTERKIVLRTLNDFFTL